MLSIASGSDPLYLTRQVGQGAEHHYLSSVAVAGEPPGRWWGAGAVALGLTGVVQPRVMDRVYGKLEHPATGAALGSRPAAMRPLGERLAAALARLPHGATDEERRAAEHTVRATHRRPVRYFDLTFSAPKSWSVFHAALQLKALQAHKRNDQAQAEHWQALADQVWDAWAEGACAALEFLQDTAGYSRAGRNGVTRVDAHQWTVALFRQHTSRNEDPQLHIHGALLNRVWTVDTEPATGRTRGKWRTLDGRFLYLHRAQAGAISERVAEEALYRRLGVRVALRPDGKAREILGITAALRDTHATRRTSITTHLAQAADAYEHAHGRPPTPYRLTCMAQEASLRTRRSKKTHAPTRQALLERWNARPAPQALLTVPQDVREAADRTARTPEPFDRNLVIARSLEAVGAAKATFTRSDIVREIDRQLPDCLGGLTPAQVSRLLDDLADDALTPWQSEQRPGRPAVARLTPPTAAAPPDELTRAETGGSRYQRPRRDLYTTDARLVTETDITEAAAAHDAPTIPAHIVQHVVDQSDLNTEQAAAARAIATSGRAIDILVGPAGTGKSHTIARLSQAWKAHGNTVLGLAVGQRQANVLTREGVPHAENIRMFLHANQHPATQPDGHDRYRLHRGQLVVVDEAGTCTTDDLHAIITLARQAGAKVLLTGDHAQTTAIGAGGLFGHLATTSPHAHTLRQVHRFHQPWERGASLRLRAGDPTILADYAARDRLHPGTTQSTRDQACRAWLTDHLAGLHTTLITTTNRDAAHLSARIRHDLVRHRRVEPDGVRLRDGNLAGVGDRLQLRHNDRTLTSRDGTRWAANRDTATVTTRTAAGDLTVSYPDGTTMDLPATYVQQHTELAYATTVHAVQATTLDTAHTLVDPRMSREKFYVAMSRGRRENHAYIPTDAGPTWTRTAKARTATTPKHRRTTHQAVLTRILRRTEHERTAVRVMQDEMDRTDAIDVLGPLWTGLVDEHYARLHGRALQNALGAHAYQSMATEDAYKALLGLARHAEERGMNAARLLQTAVALGPLDDAKSVSAVLHWRLKNRIAQAEHEQAQQHEARVQAEAATGRWGTEQQIRARHTAYLRTQERTRTTFTARTPPIPGTRGAYALRLATLLDHRVHTLGERAAAAPPPWLTARLGPVPTDLSARAAWIEAAAKAAAYREHTGYHADLDAIGPKPGTAAIDQRTAWTRAADALGIAPSDRRTEAASDAQLRAAVDTAQRERAWAPPYVAPQMRQAYRARSETRTREVSISIALAHTAGVERRAALRKALEAAQTSHRDLDRRIRHLEQIHSARTRWAAQTQDVREQARLAQQILHRRHPAMRASSQPNSTQEGETSALNLRQARRQAVRAAAGLDKLERPPTVGTSRTHPEQTTPGRLSPPGIDRDRRIERGLGLGQ
ncbi:AAA family ATPase [Yinghuangia sp. ASG 101]|uniref:MobF family relaxase n=1 Tax=Yinghuangia sp. ASG 101 TaxID=2896848 RepID=UPI001E2F197D|nr:MobF family relaxase [Yinghuangia sp. ASG 101]UGQ12040.1 AAA family ATPase [Yinghuangia sp. ASG 101]